MNRPVMVLTVVGILFATAAEAHYPVCKCEMIDAVRVTCTGGFSDGSKAPGLVLDVISSDEEVLLKGRLGSDSTLTFPRPDRDFYVLFDVGPGHTVEIDHHLIK